MPYRSSFLIALAGAGGSHWQACLAQEELIERPGPPSVDNLKSMRTKTVYPTAGTTHAMPNGLPRVVSPGPDRILSGLNARIRRSRRG